mgnify:FL=1
MGGIPCCPPSLKPRIVVYSDTENSGSMPGSDRESELTETVLRAKYADFCSAQLTEVFLSLSDEKIYEMVEEEAEIQELSPGNLGFRKMVQLATNRLRDSVPLPDFKTWQRDYEAAPERYEKYLLGLWRQLSTEETGEAG